MKNAEIAKVLEKMSNLLELKGENPFKIRAYQRAARSIEHLPKEVEAMLEQGEDLRTIPGVGEAIAKKAQELATTGKLRAYDELVAELPPGITALMELPGVGPKTASKLSKELAIASVDDLERAIQEGKVAALSGLGAKSAENILKQIQTLRRKDQRIPIGEALPVVEELIETLRSVPGVKNLVAAGSLRRFRETVGDIDLMGTSDNPEAVIGALTALARLREVLAQGPTKASVVLSNGLQVDLRMVEHDRFGSLLQYFTGSKQHNIALRTRGQKMGLKLSEYGITDTKSDTLVKYATEEKFYRRLGLQYIPPELREDQGEIALAERGALPKLIELSDIKGDLHVHSDWSDGADSIEALAMAARRFGYEYLAVTDHSAGRGSAHGLDETRLRRQIELVKKLNRRLAGIRLLTGVEVDIRADGRIDLPDKILADLDCVIASVHSAMGQDQEKMTGRVISAIENPHIDVIGHPTCRLLGEREAVAIDLEAVFRAAAKHNKALEINAMPSRLDLNDAHAFRARELGAKLAISTDSHGVAHLPFMRFGIGTARRAWCQPEDVLNTRPLKEVLAFLKSHRAG